MNIKYINNFVGTCLFSIFLTGCQTMQPFQSPANQEEHRTTISSGNIPDPIENFSKQKISKDSNTTKPLDNQKTLENFSTNQQVGESFAVPEPTLERGGKLINPDPKVQLIAPPTSIPKQRYAVPEVEQKEEYQPPARSVASKHTKGNKIKASSKNKGKVAVAQKNSKSSKTAKAPSKAKKPVAKKATTPSKVAPKKDTKKVVKKDDTDKK